MLLLLEEFLVEDLVDLSTIDLSERGEIALRVGSFEGEAIVFKLIRTSLETLRALPIVGRLI